MSALGQKRTSRDLAIYVRYGSKADIQRYPLQCLLARELQTQGYGDCRLESFTPTGTPSLRGLVKVMAGLTVEEGPHGLRCRKYRPARGGESTVDSQVGDNVAGCGVAPVIDHPATKAATVRLRSD